MKALLTRFSEPSSYAGLAGILAMLGVNSPTPLMQSISFIAAGICGVAAFFLPESK